MDVQNNYILFLVLQGILIAVYSYVGIRSLLLAKKLTSNGWLVSKRRTLLYMIFMVAILFILAEVTMIYGIDELFIWFFFDLSMVLVYSQFLSIIQKQNTKDHK